jgi:hypothetical protein
MIFRLSVLSRAPREFCVRGRDGGAHPGKRQKRANSTFYVAANKTKPNALCKSDPQKRAYAHGEWVTQRSFDQSRSLALSQRESSAAAAA